MARKTIALIVLIVQTLPGFGLTEESVTENLEITDESTSSPLATRGLVIEENLIENKGRRNPKFGFTIPFPNVPGMGDPNSTPGPGLPPDSNGFPGFPGDAVGTTATLGTTALLIKGGILSGLTALKAAIIPPIFLGALIFFLIAGAAFFTCSIVNCGRLVGDIGSPSFGPGFGSSSSYNPFNRNGIEDFEQRPVYQALDEGYKKFR